MRHPSERLWASPRQLIGALSVIAVVALALPTSVFAFPYEPLLPPMGSPGSGDGQLELGEHSGVAVNLTTHDIYVADSENHRAVVFNSSGAFTRAFGADVGGAGVDVCTSGCVSGTSESAPGAFINPTFVAIDNNPLSPSFGDVYIADNGTNLVSKFEADGTLVTSWGVNGQLDGSPTEKFDELEGEPEDPFGNPIEIAGIAVDSSGTLFVYQTGFEGLMFKFTEAGTFIEDFKTPLATAPHGIAVDSTGALYKVRGTELVVKMSATGALINGEIGCGGCAKAITVDPLTNDLYIAHQGKVERYSSASVLQETFGSPTEVSKATGIAVDPELEKAYVADQGGGSDRIDVFGPPEPGPPSVQAVAVDSITATAADLQAEVNPNQRETIARFQYVTRAQFDLTGFEGAAETSAFNLGDGKVFQDISAHLSSLLPETTYLFRVVAENEFGETIGPEPPADPSVGFTTFAVPVVLPDNRAYEMVSPPQKAGEVIPPEPSSQFGNSCGDCLPGINSPVMPMQSAPDGDSVLYLGQPFSGGLAAGPNEYLAPRGAAGWGTQSLSSAVTTGNYEAFSAGLARGVLFQIEPPLSPEAPSRGGKAFQNLYLFEGSEFDPLVSGEPPNRNPRDPGEFKIRFATANAGSALEPGFGHLLFEANDALTAAVPGVAPAAPEVKAGNACTLPGVECNLYEWHEGELALVNVLPENEDAASGAMVGAGRLLAGNQHPDVDHAISDDGSRIFWSAEETGEIYVRVDGEETLEIPTPDPGTCKESVLVSNRVCFLTASADGSVVLLSDGQVYEQNEAGSAYMASADLAEGEGGFEGILGAAEDLSRIYFVDTEALTEESEENANGEHAEAGELNLYDWDEGDPAFIGTLLPTDGAFGVDSRFGAWTASPSHRTAQVTSDGGYLAFMSVAPLTDYDNALRGNGNCGGSLTPACREAFVYSADTGNLICVSCNPSGQRPLGPSNLSLIRPGQPEAPPFPQPGNLSREGEGRLFFESQDELSPRDINGNIQDIYQWEPNGVGSCERSSGCVSLISSGASPNDSMFLDSSHSGDDAFFITRSQLLPRDKDQQLDLYDVRVDGGFEEPAEEPCNPEACKGPVPFPLTELPFASDEFRGSGNPPRPKPCKKGFVKKKGKCVKKKSKKRSRGGSK